MGEFKWKAGVALGAASLGWVLPFPGGASAAASVTITYPGPLVTTEAGGSAAFTIVLDEAPTASVRISLASSDTTEGTVGPDAVVFDATNWSIAQTVTVTGVDDPDDDGDVSFSIVTGNTESTDPNWADLPVPDVSVTNLDDEDTPGFVVAPATPLTVLESGTTAVFTLALTAQPTADVVVARASSDTTEGTVTPATSTFTAANWNVPQTVTVRGVNDFLDDGDVEFAIDQSATSADLRYEGLAVPSVAVATLDDETPAVLIVPTSALTTTEAGGSATYQVQLSSRPSTSVVVGLTSGDPSEGTPTATQLTFTRGNWNVAQTVTITGVDDAIDDGDVSYPIHHTVVTTDQRFRDIAVADVVLTNTDDDAAGVRFSPSSGLRAPEGGSVQYTVVLLSEPTAPVTVTHVSSDARQGTVSPSTTTFEPANWNVPHTVTITGVSDGVADGEAIFFVEHIVVSDDPVYSALSIPRQRVRSADDGIAPTTVPATTVPAPTTTTTPPTTTLPPTTTEEPTTTAVPTTLQASEGLVVAGPSTTVVIRTNSNLPTAGTASRRLATAAAFATVAGVVVQLVSRRRSRRA